MAAVIAFVLATVAVFAETPGLTAPIAADKLASDDMIILDARSPFGWNECGLAEDAWPMSTQISNFPKKLKSTFTQYSTAQIGLICATSGRSTHSLSMVSFDEALTQYKLAMETLE